MPEEAERTGAARSTVVLFALGLIWLAASLWAAHASISGAGDNELVAVFDAALSLPAVVAATMLAGAAAGVTMLGWLRPRLSSPGGWAATGIALVSGLVMGGLSGGMIVLGYGHRSSITVLAWAVVVAGAVGGILGSARPREMASAGLAATLAAFFVGFLLSYKQDSLMNLFDGGGSPQAQANALRPLTLLESLAAGLLAGIVAFLYLRRVRSLPHFLAYPVAGATPGIILLLAEAVTRLGGSQLFGVAGGSSELNQTAIEYSSGSRLNHGLTVLFSGAFVALIAYGLTLRQGAARAVTETGTAGANGSTDRSTPTPRSGDRDARPKGRASAADPADELASAPASAEVSSEAAED